MEPQQDAPDVEEGGDEMMLRASFFSSPQLGKPAKPSPPAQKAKRTPASRAMAKQRSGITPASPSSAATTPRNRISGKVGPHPPAEPLRERPAGPSGRKNRSVSAVEVKITPTKLELGASEETPQKDSQTSQEKAGGGQKREGETGGNTPRLSSKMRSKSRPKLPHLQLGRNSVFDSLSSPRSSSPYASPLISARREKKLSILALEKSLKPSPRGRSKQDNVEKRGGSRSSRPSLRCGGFSTRGRDPDKAFKVNQDGFVVKNGFATSREDGCEQDSLIVMIDGHGRDGHHVTNFLKRTYPVVLGDHEVKIEPESSLSASFQEVNKKLKKGDMDCSLSGASFTVMYVIGNKCFTANVGDSRAIAVKREGSMALSRDHKPISPRERARIEANGGMVAKIVYNEKDEDKQPYRVFKEGEQSPGLAMSRALGDTAAAAVGVVCTPDVNVVTLDCNVMAVLAASDGVWDRLTNDDVAELVRKCMKEGIVSPESIAKIVVEDARAKWEAEVGEGYIDDITAVMGVITWKE